MSFTVCAMDNLPGRCYGGGNYLDCCTSDGRGGLCRFSASYLQVDLMHVPGRRSSCVIRQRENVCHVVCFGSSWR